MNDFVTAYNGNKKTGILINKKGIVLSKFTGKRLKVFKKTGYSVIFSQHKTFTLHKLLLSTFCPVNGCDNMLVEHIDGDTLNNSLNNLTWVTRFKKYSKLRKGSINFKHGRSRTKSYKAWKAMIRRCTNNKDLNYRIYGGRGIKVCKKWLVYENFFKDMGEPKDGLFLDRTNVNGNYEPKNCKWVNIQQSSSNRRTSIFLTLDGINDTISGHSRRKNINVGTVYSRLRNNWPIESAFNKRAQYKKDVNNA